MHWRSALGLLALVVAATVLAGELRPAGEPGDRYLPWEGGAAYYKKWVNGPPADQGFFPISVWYQSASNAPRYRAIGVNQYIGPVSRRPGEGLEGLRRAGMTLIGPQSAANLASPEKDIIRGWFLFDEPDNAQAKPGRGMGLVHSSPRDDPAIRGSHGQGFHQARLPELRGGMGLVHSSPRDDPAIRGSHGQGFHQARLPELRAGRGERAVARARRRLFGPLRALRRVHQRRRHRLLRRLSGERAAPVVVGGEGHRPPARLGAVPQAGLGLDRNHSLQRRAEAHDGRREVRGVDVDYPRRHGRGLLLPRLQTAGERSGAA